MISLLNVSEQKGIKYGKGKQIYQLRVNLRVLCEVEHAFEDGAAALLRRAADALEQAERPKEPEPYINKTMYHEVRLYNREFGDDRICNCGHTYDRHFDHFEEPEHQDIGCKYCDCYTFTEGPNNAKQN